MPRRRSTIIKNLYFYFFRFFCAVQPLSNKLSYFYGLPGKPFLASTVGQFIDKAAEKHPDREAYIFCESGRRATFEEFKVKVMLNLSPAKYSGGICSYCNYELDIINCRKWIGL